MRLVKITFWTALFLAATFFWVVLFEYGPAGFGEGAKAEFQGLRALFGRG